MKRILLDTHALIWWMCGDKKLGHDAKEQIATVENTIYVSAATVWEMSIKQQMGKLLTSNFGSILVKVKALKKVAV